jgi:hypothetical protein
MNRNIHRQIAEERGVDIRNPSSAIFGVSSQDRYGSITDKLNRPTSPFNFTLGSKQNFMYGYFTRIALTEIKFTWAIPTISANNNLINIVYQPNGAGPTTTYVLDIQWDTTPSANPGWFTPTTLAAELQSLIRVATGNTGFTLTASTINGQFLADTNNTDKFYFAPNPTEPTLYNMMNWFGSTLDVNQYSGTASMLRTQFVDIVCSQLTYNQDVKDGDTGQITRDILARVYLAPEADALNPELIGSQPFQIYRDFTFPKQIKWSPNQPITSGLQFQVYDDQGVLLTSGNNIIDFQNPDWNMTLLVSEV